VVFVDKLRPHIPALRRAGATGKQISTIDNLISAVSTPTDGTEDVTPVSSAPTSPLLRLDVNSAAATPNLTISPNSPLSSPSTSPPSTNAGAAEEVADSKGKGKAHVYQPQPNDLD
jgi:mRNA-binding protein PUF3